MKNAYNAGIRLGDVSVLRNFVYTQLIVDTTPHAYSPFQIRPKMSPSGNSRVDITGAPYRVASFHFVCFSLISRSI